jgi:tetratricopeptide (TPR) repeat protein
MNKSSNKKWPLLICLGLAAVTLAVYFQVHSFAFINLDDPAYVSGNQNVQAGVTLKTIKWALGTGLCSNWHPLTWLSLMLDSQLLGFNPAVFHLVNVFFHIANALLLFLVLKQMTNSLWQSAFVAALFALHPLHVESVAWVSERKDVLSTFFWLLTMAAYLRYVKKPGAGGYLLIMVVFALGLMAKPMLVTLPFVLLLLDYWPLNRISRFSPQIIYRLVWEKVPLLALAAGSSVITFFVQHNSQAVVTLTMFPIKYRLLGVFVSYAEYIEKMFWPVKLAFFYPNPGQEVSILYAVMSAIFLLAVTILILLFSKNHRYLITGWFWYIGTLVPVIGIVQVGSQAIADRYSYITLTGLFIIIAWGMGELSAKWQYRKIALQISAYTVLCALASITYIQTGYWKNTLTLSEHAVKVTKDNYLAYFSAIPYLREQGRMEDAVQFSYEAVKIQPDNPDALQNMGLSLCYANRTGEAIAYLEKALQIQPQNSAIHNNLGIALGSQRRYDEAIVHFKKALQIDPNSTDAKNNLNIALTKKQNPNK